MNAEGLTKRHQLDGGPDGDPVRSPAVPRFLTDISPLREFRDFRYVWTGQVVNQFGSQLTLIALQKQLFDLTDSKLELGLLGAAQLVPLVASSVVGGTVADTFDKRRILLITQLLMALCSVGLALNGLALNGHGGRPHVWPIFVLAALNAAVVGCDWPTRQAMVPAIVGPEKLESAIALNIMMFNIAMVFGPLVAGVLISASGVRAAYVVDSVTYLWCFAMISRIRPVKPRQGGAGVSLASIKEGFRYLGTQRLLQATFVADLNAMIFGMPRVLFPPMAKEVFKGGARTLGLLNSAPAIGALIAGLGSGWFGRVRRQGRAVIVCIVVWGIAIAGFGAVPWLWAAVVCLVVAGGADMVSAVYRSSISQKTATDEMRGRMSAIFISVVRGGPLVGDFEGGVVAQIGGTQFSAVSGGLACVVFMALIARVYPELRTYTNDLSK